nr:ribonuclease H-like domain-containing protein [Tanacetum cinerariifolium]
MNQFCEMNGLRQFSVARTTQQSRVADRRNMILIDASRTMLATSKLPTTFWAEAVSTACYVQNRVLVVKPHNKTLYEVFHGRTPTLSFMRPFGCLVTILNTMNHLGKFNGKADECFFIGYSLNSKAFRVFNSRTRIVEENLHIRFSKSTPNIVESGPDWLFDIDALTRTMNYEPIIADEAVHKELGDSLVRVATTASILEAEQDSGNDFWSTAKAKTINGEVQLRAQVDGKKIIITKSSIRIDLQLADEEDEAVHKELGDSLVRVATTASILEAEQDSGNDVLDACPNACKMWKAIERLKQGESINVQDLETNLFGNLESSHLRMVNHWNRITQEPLMVTEDEETSKDKEIDKLMALISLSFKKIYKPTNNNLRTSSNTSHANQDNSSRINRSAGYENQRNGNVTGARETEEARIQLNAKQADWKDDTDDESDDQELEAHYMYMAKVQEVSPDAVDSGPIFDTKPEQKVHNDDHYDVFLIECQHSEQSESVHKTYLTEQDVQNVLIESVDMSYDSKQIDQNDEDADLAKERGKDRPPVLAPGGKDRLPVLAPGWKNKPISDSEGNPTTSTERIFETYKNVKQEIRDHLNAEAEAVQIILTGIDNDIYSTVDACPNACEMWKAIERFYKMMNELIRNQCKVTNHQVNVQFLLQLQKEWQRAEKLARVADPLALVAQQPVYRPQTHPTHYKQNSSTRSQQAATKNRGKAIINSPQPIYDEEPSMVAEDEETSKDKEIDKLMALISLSFKKIYKPTNNNLRTSSNTSRANQDNSLRIKGSAGYENQRNGNVDGPRETVEQVDWKDDTDDESDDQELEAHYMYMAKVQEVSPDVVDSGPIFDTEPEQKVHNDDHYDVFAIECQHSEQSESVHKTYLTEQDVQNVLIESVDMSYDSENRLTRMMKMLILPRNSKEANNKLSKENDLLYVDYTKSQAELARRNTKEYASQMELECAKGNLRHWKAWIRSGIYGLWWSRSKLLLLASSLMDNDKKEKKMLQR